MPRRPSFFSRRKRDADFDRLLVLIESRPNDLTEGRTLSSSLASLPKNAGQNRLKSVRRALKSLHIETKDKGSERLTRRVGRRPIVHLFYIRCRPCGIFLHFGPVESKTDKQKRN